MPQNAHGSWSMSQTQRFGNQPKRFGFYGQARLQAALKCDYKLFGGFCQEILGKRFLDPRPTLWV
jgi:hypothetical protein